MAKINKLPHALFIIGVIFIGLYGLVLSVFAVLVQIFFILRFWQRNPSNKQSKKFIIGVVLYAISLVLFGIGLYEFHTYFGGIAIIMWLVIGSLPFLAGSLILLSISTAQKIQKK